MQGQVRKQSRAMALWICEIPWLKIILEDMKIDWKKPMQLYCNNKLLIHIMHSLVQHDKTKHVEGDKHFIKEKLENGTILKPLVSSGNQLVDVLTKGLTGATLQSIVGRLGMDDIHSPT